MNVKRHQNISYHHDMKTKAHQSKDEVEGGVVADIVVIDSLSVLKLLSAKDDALLFGWDALLCAAKERKSSSKSVKYRRSCRIESFGEKMMEPIISPVHIKVIPSHIHTPLTLSDLGLDVLDRFSLLDFDRDGLAGEGLDEELLGAST